VKYFPGFNALRFMAALLVIMHHVEQIRQNYGLPNLKMFAWFNNGSLAVNFFFVLSGFLITHLLLAEHDKTGTVSIKQFYLKRLLRIWPLYFLLILIGFVVLPFALPSSFASKFPYLSWEGLLLYVLFLPNLAKVIWGNHILVPLWSIGVEEQFYLLWAPLVKWFKRYLLWIMLGVWGLIVTVCTFSEQLFDSSLIIAFVKTLNFDQMAVGGLFAWYYHQNKGHLAGSFVFTPWLQIVVWLFVVAKFSMRYVLSEQNVACQFLFSSPFAVRIDSVMFAVLILNVGANTNALVKLRAKVLDELGKLSYGMYMYHMIFIYSAVLILKKFETVWPIPLQHCFMYMFVVGITMVVSWCSFHFFEKHIIGLNKRTL
jgi:peptidoglycan/LPS O-acetylase OafA/YrhL